MSKLVGSNKKRDKSFNNPPLVEIIAELRWGGVDFPTLTPGAQVNIPASSFEKQEKLFRSFTDQVAALGYNQVERVVPVGFPFFPFQPIYRYRKEKSASDSTLYQIGAGIFSANVTPPYREWNDFRPVILQGVELLFRGIESHEVRINAGTLRYINAFKNNLTKGKKVKEFIGDILGFRVDLPQIILDQTLSNEEIIPLFKLIIPLKTGYQMSLTVAEGKVADENAVLMDIAVSYNLQEEATVESIMNALDSAHDSIYDLFMSVTEKLHTLMNTK